MWKMARKVIDLSLYYDRSIGRDNTMAVVTEKPSRSEGERVEEKRKYFEESFLMSTRDENSFAMKMCACCFFERNSQDTNLTSVRWICLNTTNNNNNNTNDKSN